MLLNSIDAMRGALSVAANPTAGLTNAAGLIDAAGLTNSAGPTNLAGVTPTIGLPPGGKPVGEDFGAILNGYVAQVDASQHKADSMVQRLAVGDAVDVHQVMLALNEASGSINLMLQVRNKALEAYQEIMRTPL